MTMLNCNPIPYPLKNVKGQISHVSNGSNMVRARLKQNAYMDTNTFVLRVTFHFNES